MQGPHVLEVRRQLDRCNVEQLTVTEQLMKFITDEVTEINARCSSIFPFNPDKASSIYELTAEYLFSAVNGKTVINWNTVFDELYTSNTSNEQLIRYLFPEYPAGMVVVVEVKLDRSKVINFASRVGEMNPN